MGIERNAVASGGIRAGLGLALAAMLLLAGAAPPAGAVTFTSDTVIDRTNTLYEGQEIVVSGCTLTLGGQHTFSSLQVLNNGLVRSTGYSSLPEDRLVLNTALDVVVDPGSRIAVDGQGYPGSAGPGRGGDSTGSGGGAGYGGAGGWSYHQAVGGATYGSETDPAEFGSGGGAGAQAPRGAGGGALRLNVGGTLHVDGEISADGLGETSIYMRGGGGSGGSITLVVGTLSGAGLITANGGHGDPDSYFAGGGGGGRVAVYYGDAVTMDPTRIRALGGWGFVDGWNGTVVLLPKPASRQQPDMLVRAASSQTYLGAGVLSIDGAGETATQSVANAQPATYVLKVVNAGQAAEPLTITGTAGGSGWSVLYYDAPTGGANITTAVTSATGWGIPSLAPGGSKEFRVVVTPATTLMTGTLRRVMVTATSTLEPAQRDTVGAQTTVSGPDLLAKKSSQADSAYALDNVYQKTPAGGQILSQTVTPGVVARYYVRLQNDSNVSRALVLRAVESTVSGWSVVYKYGATDITPLITATGGYTTPSLPALTGVMTLLVEATPAATTPSGTKSVVLRVFLNAADTVVRDAIQASTTVTTAGKPDLLIKNYGETDTAYALDNVYQSSPSGGQVRVQTVLPGRPARYYVRLQNDGAVARTYVVKAVESSGAGWSITYRYGSTDITSLITGSAGYTTPTLAANTGALTLLVQVTPGSTVRGNALKIVTLRAFLDGVDTTVRDSIRADTTAGVVSAPDLLIKKYGEADTAYAYNNVYQSTPSGAQVEAQAVAAGAPARYLVRMQNDGNTSRAFLLKAAASSGNGWTITYKYGSTDITSLITGAGGYTTPTLGAFTGAMTLVVEVLPGSRLRVGAAKTSTLTVTLDGTEVTPRDAVQAATSVASGP